MSRVRGAAPWVVTAAVIAVVVCAVGRPRDTLTVAEALGCLGIGGGALWLGGRLFLEERRPRVDRAEARPAVECAGCIACGGPDCIERPENDLTADEARELVDDLRLQLDRAQEAVAHVREFCDTASREGHTITGDQIQKWLRSALDAWHCGLVIARTASGPDPDTARTHPDDTPDTPGQDTPDQAGHHPDTARTTPDSSLRLRIANAIRHALKTRTTPQLVDALGRPLAGGIGLDEYDLADIALAELQPELADADTAVRGVQAWMALDLHRALGRGTNVAADCQHQGFKSWADWWADLIAQVRRGYTTAHALGKATAAYCPHCGRGDIAPTTDDWAREFQRAEAAEAALVLARDAHARLAAYLTGFADVLDDTDRGPWANTGAVALADLKRALNPQTEESSW